MKTTDKYRGYARGGGLAASGLKVSLETCFSGVGVTREVGHNVAVVCLRTADIELHGVWHAVSQPLHPPGTRGWLGRQSLQQLDLLQGCCKSAVAVLCSKPVAASMDRSMDLPGSAYCADAMPDRGAIKMAIMHKSKKLSFPGRFKASLRKIGLFGI